MSLTLNGVAQTRHARNTSSKQGLSETKFLPIVSFVEDVLLQMSVGGEVNLHYQVSITSSQRQGLLYHGERNVSWNEVKLGFQKDMQRRLT